MHIMRENERGLRDRTDFSGADGGLTEDAPVADQNSESAFTKGAVRAAVR